eukprot:2452148-Amphidinium_carterae.1
MEICEEFLTSAPGLCGIWEAPPKEDTPKVGQSHHLFSGRVHGLTMYPLPRMTRPQRKLSREPATSQRKESLVANPRRATKGLEPKMATQNTNLFKTQCDC